MGAIQVTNLRRDFKTTIGVIRREAKTVVAVDDISFEVADQELFGLLRRHLAGQRRGLRVPRLLVRRSILARAVTVTVTVFVGARLLGRLVGRLRLL